MKVDFFRITMPDGADPFERLLAAVEEMPDDDSRTVDIGGQNYRLQRLKSSNRTSEGDIIRIRMDEPLLVAKLDGHVKPVELDDDEGIGSETAFLYDRHNKTLIIQVNRNGVSAGILVKYFALHGELSQPIVADHVPRPDVMESLSRLQTVRKFRVRLAGCYDPKLVVGHKPAAGKAVELLDDSYAPHIDVTISMGRGRGTLPVDTIARKAKKLFAHRTLDEDVEVESVEIYGQYEDDTPAELKLLNFTMRETVRIPPSQDRIIPYDVRRDAVRTAWERRRNQLTEIFSS